MQDLRTACRLTAAEPAGRSQAVAMSELALDALATASAAVTAREAAEAILSAAQEQMSSTTEDLDDLVEDDANEPTVGHRTIKSSLAASRLRNAKDRARMARLFRRLRTLLASDNTTSALLIEVIGFILTHTNACHMDMDMNGTCT